MKSVVRFVATLSVAFFISSCATKLVKPSTPLAPIEDHSPRLVEGSKLA